MKKFFIVTVLIGAFVVMGQAQPRAIGGRLGWGAEVSYQHGFGESNMLQIDAGLFGFGAISATATYDWLFGINSWQEKGSWNWYAGVGGGVGYSWGGYGFVGVAGMIGVEYNFWFPLQLSLDYRPVIGPYFIRGYAGFNWGGLYCGALSIRYKF